MFADDDDSTDDSTELSHTDSALGTSMTSGSSLRLSQESKAESTNAAYLTKLNCTSSSTSKATTPPEHKFAMPTKLPSQDSSGPFGNLSGSSPKAFSDSLMSTAASPNHFGLNARLQAVLNAKNSTPAKLYRFSSDSSPASGVTPPIYTLNNGSTISTQRPVFSGPHYGLSAEVWKVVQECKGVQTLYQWQEECLKKALESTLNLIYSLPTSGGKTLVAELLMVREMLCNKKNCLYVLPYVSIVQEKIRTLSSLAVALDFSLEEYAGNRGSFPPRKRNSKNVMFIATLEKANGIANSLMQEGRLQEIGKKKTTSKLGSISLFNYSSFPIINNKVSLSWMKYT
jgi:POLQ-like helicase